MVLGTIVAGIVYRFHTKRIFSEAALFGLFVFLVKVGGIVLLEFLHFNLNNFLLIGILYFLSSIAILQLKRFKVQKPFRTAIWVATASIIVELIRVQFQLFLNAGLVI